MAPCCPPPPPLSRKKNHGLGQRRGEGGALVERQAFLAVLTWGCATWGVGHLEVSYLGESPKVSHCGWFHFSGVGHLLLQEVSHLISPLPLCHCNG